MQVEVTGKQFGWIFRYPGKDGVFGKKYFQNISDAGGNSLGLLWDDEATHDDIVVPNEMYIVKDQPVKFIINSRDVVHDVGLVYFRQKMDAVPGTPTTLWFIPKYTTEEMKKKLGNPDFEYEVSCDQMCGRGHYTMRGIIKVVTHDEFVLWMAKQTPNYVQVFPDKGPAGPVTPGAPATPAKDSTKMATIKPHAGTGGIASPRPAGNGGAAPAATKLLAKTK
jgi:cytochrome c oxidase subunit 2